MQNVKNKLARASWKYHFFKDADVENYANYLTDAPSEFDFNSLRKTTITKLNFFKPAVISTGKYTVEKYLTKYHIGFKLGGFTKNRKPFYFRSKKKKNVTKKYNLPTQP